MEEYSNSISKFNDPFWSGIISKHNGEEHRIAKELCNRNIYHHSTISTSGPASRRVTVFCCWSCDRKLTLTVETKNE